MKTSTWTYILALVLALWCAPTQTKAQTYGVTDEANNQNTPQSWTAVQLPTGINTSNVVKITDYSALTSAADNHDAIQSAIDAVAAKSDGGVVVIPAGTWLSSGTIELKSHTILHLAKGATLKLMKLGELPDNAGETDYTSKASKHTYNLFIGVTKDNVSDVIIEGEDSTSVIDGQGADWWPLREKKGFGSTWFKDSLGRPGMIRFEKGTRTLVKKIKIINAPGTNLALGRSNNGSHMTVHDIWIREPASETAHLKYYWTGWGTQTISHNTDGIPVWCPYVNIYNCDIRNGDDNVVIDSNGQFVHIWDCTFGTGHGASMGSYTSNVHDILWENIKLEHTTAGIRLKTQRTRSGSVYNIIYRDITMDDVEGPISIDSYYSGKPSTPSGASSADSTGTTPYFHDILIQNVTATNGTDNAIYLYGLPESYIQNVTFDNVNVTSKKGMFMAFCRGIKFVNGCKISPASFATQYNATTHGNYSGTYTNASSSSTTTELGAELTTLNTTTSTTAKDATTYTFNNGYTITNTDNKGYGGGKENTIKYSNGTQYTINLPSGVSVGAVKFKGYDNYNGTDSYLSELNGTTFSSTDYVFPQKDASENYTIKEHTIFLTSTATSTLTFKFAGKQVCEEITLYAPGTSTTTTVETDVKTGEQIAVLSDDTNKGSTANTTSTYYFNSDAYTITNTDNKEYGAGTTVASSKTVKYSAGTQYTINLPSGVSVAAVKFSGYDNYDGADSYLSELNGTTYSSTDYVFPQKDASGNSTTKEYTVPLSSAATSTLTFTFRGKQVCAVITLYAPVTAEPVYLSDRATKYNQVAVDPADVTLLGRSFVSTSWNTICLPFDVSAADLKTYFGDGTELATFDQKKTEKDALYFNTTTGGIEAGVPYLIRPGRSNTEDIVFEGVNLTTTEAQTLTNSSTQYSFVGTYLATSLPTDGTGWFLVSGNKLRQATSSNNVMRGYRCYVLSPSGSTGAKVARFVVSEPEATGITNVTARAAATAEAWYTLSGQRVDRAHLGRGIYIHGGKKVVIR